MTLNVVQVFKLGLAKSIHHARVLIKQRHIRVRKQVQSSFGRDRSRPDLNAIQPRSWNKDMLIVLSTANVFNKDTLPVY